MAITNTEVFKADISDYYNNVTAATIMQAWMFPPACYNRG